MLNQELIDYIKKAKEAGQTDEQIKNALLANGWQASDIEEGFRAINPLGVNYPKKSHKKLILVTGGIVLLSIITAGVYLWKKPLQNLNNGIDKEFVAGETILGDLIEQNEMRNIRGHVEFSPDGKHFMYVYNEYLNQKTGEVVNTSEEFMNLLRQNRSDLISVWRVILDNKEVFKSNNDTDLIDIIGFSPDENNYHYVYKIMEKGSTPGHGPSYYVIDGIEQKTYDDVSDFSFSKDGKHYLYQAKSKESYLAVYDGAEKQRQKAMLYLKFLTDENGYKYEAGDTDILGEMYCVTVVNGVPKKEPLCPDKVYSPDKNHYAYLAGEFGRTLVYDGKEIEKNLKYGSEIRYLTFSADSKNFAYVKREISGNNKKEYLIKNGQILYTLDFSKDSGFSGGTFIRNLIFSPDSQQLAAIDGYFDFPSVITIDNGGKLKSEKHDRGALISDLSFSPNGDKLVYKVRQSDKAKSRDEQFLVVNGAVYGPYIETQLPQKAYDTGGSVFITAFGFSPTGKHLAYAVDIYKPADAQKRARLVIDGKLVSGFYDKIDNLHFVSDNQLVFNAFKDNKILLVVKSLN